MPAEKLKSNPIINLDSFPIVTNTTGEGDDGMMRCVNGHVATTAGATTGASPNNSTYRLARIPTKAKVKHVYWLSTNAPGAGAVDIDVAFSDSLVDGTPPSLSQLANPFVQITGPADNKLFGAAITVPATGTITELTFKNNFTSDMVNLPLWQVLVNLGATQFTSDPGGFFDIMFNVTTAITNSVDIAVEVQYCV